MVPINVQAYLVRRSGLIDPSEFAIIWTSYFADLDSGISENVAA